MSKWYRSVTAVFAAPLRAWFDLSDAQRVAVVVAATIAGLFIGICRVRGSDADLYRSADLKCLRPERVKDLYDRRMKQYTDDQARFVSLIKYQGIVLVAAAYLLCRPLENVELKGFGFKLPPSFVQACLPIALLYLWLEFGYLLHELILNRTVIWHLDCDLDSKLNYKLGFESVVSGHGLLKDNFFLDEYFLAFNQSLAGIVEGGKGMSAINRLVVAFFGIFWGVIQGCALATIANIYDEGPANRFRKLLAAFYFVTVGGLIFVSHVQFNFAGHPNWLQIVIVSACLASTSVFCQIARVSTGLPNRNDLSAPIDSNIEAYEFAPSQLEAAAVGEPRQGVSSEQVLDQG